MKRNVAAPLLAGFAGVVVVATLASARPHDTRPTPRAQIGAAQYTLTCADTSMVSAVAKRQLGGNVSGTKVTAVVSTYRQYMGHYASGVRTAAGQETFFGAQVLVVSITGDLSGVVIHHPPQAKVRLGHQMVMVLQGDNGRVLGRKIELLREDGASITPDQQAQFPNLSVLGQTPTRIPLA